MRVRPLRSSTIHANDLAPPPFYKQFSVAFRRLVLFQHLERLPIGERRKEKRPLRHDSAENGLDVSSKTSSEDAVMKIIAQNESAATSNLVHSAISHRNLKSNVFVASVEVYSGMSAVRYHGVALTGKVKKDGGRGQVTTFSRKSRRRMMEAMLKKSNYVRPLFLTLTYTDESLHPADHNRPYKRDIDCFNKRLQREFPNSGHIWRIEYEKRKSGRFKGHTVPHFHLVVDGVLDDIAYLRKELRAWWWSIITDDHKIEPAPRVDVQVSQSKKHAMYYLSKYVAKENEKNDFADGHQHNSDCNGRHWAVVGNWQQTVVATIHLTRREFLDLRRLCVRYLKSRGSTYAKRLAASRSQQGYSIYGLGKDAFSGQFVDEATIFKMLQFVTGLYRC